MNSSISAIQFNISHLFALSLNVTVRSEPWIGPYQVLPLRAILDLGVMAMKGVFCVPQSSSLTGSSPSDCLMLYAGDSLLAGGVSSRQRCSRCILQHFNLGTATRLRKGKLNSNQFLSWIRMGSVRIFIPKTCNISRASTTKPSNSYLPNPSALEGYDTRLKNPVCPTIYP